MANFDKTSKADPNRGAADFFDRWSATLSALRHDDYCQVAGHVTYDELPTRGLPEQAQRDIDFHKRPITGSNILVLNHPFCLSLGINGSSLHSDCPIEREYLSNIRRLLGSHGDFEVVIFDYPEYYVFDSRERLLQGKVSTVILTPFDQGGSLFPKQALKEIGSGKTIFVAGATDACLGTTAKELWLNDNEVVLLNDAIYHGGPPVHLACPEAKEAKEYLEIDSVRFCSVSEFIEQLK